MCIHQTIISPRSYLHRIINKPGTGCWRKNSQDFIQFSLYKHDCLKRWRFYCRNTTVFEFLSEDIWAHPSLLSRARRFSATVNAHRRYSRYSTINSTLQLPAFFRQEKREHYLLLSSRLRSTYSVFVYYGAVGVTMRLRRNVASATISFLFLLRTNHRFKECMRLFHQIYISIELKLKYNI